MSAFLITGVPGSGKSSVAAELNQCGLAAIDADEDEELARWVRVSGHPDVPSQALSEWCIDHRWQWNPFRIDQLIEASSGESLFICGGASNVDDVVRCFDKVIALEIDVETLAARLDAIDRASGITGGEGDTQDQIGGWLPQRQQHLRELGAVMVDGKQSVQQVVSAILAETSTQMPKSSTRPSLRP